METIDYSKFRQITIKDDLPVKFQEDWLHGDKELYEVFIKNNIISLED